MSGSSNYPDRSSLWIWLSFLPIIGGLAIAYAGKKINNQSWLSVGIAFTIISFIFASQDVFTVIWLSQVGMGLYVRQKLVSNSLISGGREGQVKPWLSRIGEKIDINTCSKHELVHQLGLPIVYANDIDSVRQEGYMFTHLEELSEVAGLPENYLRKISPFVTFSYDLRKETDTSWRCINSYSETELITAGIDTPIAKRMIEERERNGFYRSAIDIRNRTGIPLKSYQTLL